MAVVSCTSAFFMNSSGSSNEPHHPAENKNPTDHHQKKSQGVSADGPKIVKFDAAHQHGDDDRKQDENEQVTFKHGFLLWPDRRR